MGKYGKPRFLLVMWCLEFKREQINLNIPLGNTNISTVHDKTNITFSSKNLETKYIAVRNKWESREKTWENDHVKSWLLLPNKAAVYNELTAKLGLWWNKMDFKPWLIFAVLTDLPQRTVMTSH